MPVVTSSFDSRCSTFSSLPNLVRCLPVFLHAFITKWRKITPATKVEKDGRSLTEILKSAVSLLLKDSNGTANILEYVKDPDLLNYSSFHQRMIVAYKDIYYDNEDWFEFELAANSYQNKLVPCREFT